jgi:mannose-1-phosphate guanylyltransferase
VTPKGAGGRPVIAALLAGGKGTRFWPASRAENPKQFLRLLGDRSLLREAYERFLRILPPERILIVTGTAYAERTRQELPEMPPGNLILEPSGRDTAPAAVLAVRAAAALAGDPIVIIAPTDHHIADQPAFERALAAGIEAAGAGALVTFGIVPDRPATVYGYIEVEKKLEKPDEALAVLRFREKPDAEEAARFLATGRFFWNAGIFLWRASVFDTALAAASPALHEAARALPSPAGAAPGPGGAAKECGAPSFAPGFEKAWEDLPAISIDYALMEKAAGVRVVPLRAGWSDLGGWDAVREFMTEDETGNREAPDTLFVGSTGCSVHRAGISCRAPGSDPAGSLDAPRAPRTPGAAKSPGTPNPKVTPETAGSQEHAGKPRLVALVGCEGLIVVETPDALLVCREGAGEALREVVRRLRSGGREDLL